MSGSRCRCRLLGRHRADLRLFGERFAAIGFDASASECRRLAAEETSPNVHYVSGFVASHPTIPSPSVRRTHRPITTTFSRGRVPPGHSNCAPSGWPQHPDREKMQHNAWHETELADASQPVFVSETLEKFGFDWVDFSSWTLMARTSTSELSRRCIRKTRHSGRPSGSQHVRRRRRYHAHIPQYRSLHASARLDDRSYSMRRAPLAIRHHHAGAVGERPDLPGRGLLRTRPCRHPMESSGRLHEHREAGQARGNFLGLGAARRRRRAAAEIPRPLFGSVRCRQGARHAGGADPVRRR